MLLKSKTAVITGCNKGIGKKILEVISANGATVFACVRNIDEEFKSFLNKLMHQSNNQHKQKRKKVTEMGLAGKSRYFIMNVLAPLLPS